MKRCSKCFLPKTYPGIQFDSKGKCNYCNYLEASANARAYLRKSLKEDFLTFIEEVKARDNEYDCVVCYSGGKDSTFLLLELKEKLGLNILAYTFNNGFLSEKAVANIERMIKKLDVEHIMFTPEKVLARKVFKEALTGKISYPKEITAILSPLCAVCQGMIVAYAYRLAKKKDIPIIFMGFTPGQYPDVSYENFMKARSCIYFSDSVHKDDPPDIIKMIRDPVDEVAGEEAEKYFLKSQYLEPGEKYPHILFPFHAIFKYDEKEIYDRIKKIGWKKPEDTDSCSTNCLINTVGNYAFKKQYGYHPYAAEISSMVRKGVLSFKEARDLEQIDEESSAMRSSLEKLGLQKDMLFKGGK